MEKLEGESDPRALRSLCSATKTCARQHTLCKYSQEDGCLRRCAEKFSYLPRVMPQDLQCPALLCAHRACADDISMTR